MIEKNRLLDSAYDELTQAVSDRDSRSEVPDIPDRMVTATDVYFRCAGHFNVPVISRNGRIRAAGRKTVFKNTGPIEQIARRHLHLRLVG